MGPSSLRRSRLRVLGLVLVAAGAFAALIPGRAAAQPDERHECATVDTVAPAHAPPATHDAGQQTIPAGASLGGPSQCDHCSTPACAMTGQCGGPSTTMGSAVTGFASRGSCAAVHSTRARPHPRSFQPPTPPPNGLS